MIGLSDAITLSIGIITGIVSNYGYDFLRSIAVRGERLSMEGSWAEHVPDSKGHEYSFGRIYWDRRRKIYAFDGTNYSSSGEN